MSDGDHDSAVNFCTTPVSIFDEESLLAFIENAPSTIFKLSHNELPLRFEQWHNNKIVLTGLPSFTLNYPMIQTLTEYQNAIYRAYAISVYGVKNAKQLTNDEKRALELKVKVGEGSAVSEINVTEIIESFMKEGLSRMDPTTVAILAGVTMLLLLTALGMKLYYDDRKDKRRTETERGQLQAIVDVTKTAIELSNSAQKESSQRLSEAIARLADREPKVRQIATVTNPPKDALMKVIESTGDASFMGETITREQARDAIGIARRRSQEARVDGTFRIRQVDLKDIGGRGIKIKVDEVQSGKTYNAVLLDSMDQSQRKIVRDAEWGNRLVKLKLNVSLLGDMVNQAIIVDAEQVNTTLTDIKTETDNQARNELA